MTRGYCLFKGEACRLGQSHPGVVSVRAAGRGFLEMEEFLAARCPCCGVLMHCIHDFAVGRARSG